MGGNNYHPTLLNQPACFQPDRTPTPGCEWVLAGDGTAHRLHQGPCLMFDGFTWHAACAALPGLRTPPGFTPVGRDPYASRCLGWQVVTYSPHYPQFMLAMEAHLSQASLTPAVPPCGAGAHIATCWPAGTYSLHDNSIHPHATPHVDEAPYLGPAGTRTYGGIRRMVLDLATEGCPGLTYRHPDGRHAAARAVDFFQESL